MAAERKSADDLQLMISESLGDLEGPTLAKLVRIAFPGSTVRKIRGRQRDNEPDEMFLVDLTATN